MGVNDPENPSLMKIAASFGFMIFVLTQFIGPVSGGHINTAVSLSLWIAGKISFIRYVAYTISQMIGSIFGGLALWAIFGSNWPAARAFGSNSWDPAIFNDGQILFSEMIGTGILILTVFALLDHRDGDGGPLGTFPIGMSVMVAHLFLLEIDGCSINPTRSFGPTVVAIAAGIPGDYIKQHYIFWIGPYLGSVAASLGYLASKAVVQKDPSHPEEHFVENLVQPVVERRGSQTTTEAERERERGGGRVRRRRSHTDAITSSNETLKL
eukprot:CAMPEP_0182429194 /NCGR_PEP_ID=MMETSP1167-20130531/25565_1 /TAXON_ID=2988 /ORGANISM="Mallomonas Sp, Strain CCMP3275" /LENGTH=267 /DNA_ID=CAMNT_0024612575 /DNA_START=221 /DNA_END=1024 /DNA_ORIENTATION=+